MERSSGEGLGERGKGKKASPPVSSRLFLLAPVSLRCERTLSTNQKGTACSLEHPRPVLYRIDELILSNMYYLKPGA